MSELNSSGPLGAVLGDYALKEPPPKDKSLGRDEFLQLLVTQLEHQDPLSPQDNGQFVAQLAQFSSLEESQKLTQGFEEFAGSFLSSQHLQATSMVGRPVHVASDRTLLANEGAVSVLAEIPADVDSATLSVFNDAGALVDSFALGEQSAGRNEFIWTGTDSDDQRYNPGIYRFEVNVTRAEESTTVPIFLSSNVNSVTIEPGGALTLNLAGIGPTSMSEVIQIN